MKRGNAKVFVAILILFCAATVAQQTVSELLSRSGFRDVMASFEDSLHQMRLETAENLEAMSLEDARDLMAEIQIGIGESLQPGEAQKFLYLANKQTQLRGLKEFSFYGPDGLIELSSDENAEGRAIAPDVWAEGERTRELVVRTSEEKLQLFDPMFADPDLVRFQPGLELGQFYGMLYVELSRERVNSVIAGEREVITAALEEARFRFDMVKRRSMIAAVCTVLVCALLVAGALHQVINRWMQRPIQHAVENLLGTAGSLDLASRQVADASTAVAQGTTEQAASLEQSTAALEQMSSQTSQTATDADQVKNAAAAVNTSSRKSYDSLGRMSEAIKDIRAAANESAAVIATIDSIAFQTNLLALNAAVEAARAGDAGRGFSVVAEEVRNLARRSADAARDTSQLIEHSVARSEQGVQVCAEVVEQLDVVVAGIDEVSELISSVATATDQQARSIAEVNGSVVQMDKMTQENAVRADQTASASSELNHQSRAVKNIAQELLRLAGGKTEAAETVESVLS